MEWLGQGNEAAQTEADARAEEIISQLRDEREAMDAAAAGQVDSGGDPDGSSSSEAGVRNPESDDLVDLGLLVRRLPGSGVAAAIFSSLDDALDGNPNPSRPGQGH